LRSVDASEQARGGGAQIKAICGNFYAARPGSVTMSGMRARTFWFLTLPALFVAETAAHTFVARALDSGDARHRLLSNVVADYALPFIAIVVLLAAAIVGQRVLASYRAEGPQPLPSWRLAALPALGFAVQEQTEQLVNDGRVGWLTALEPIVLGGVALQLVWGLLAIWLVRTLLRAAEELGCTLARRSPRVARRPQRLRVRPFRAPEPRLPALASRQAGRAPPAVA